MLTPLSLKDSLTASKKETSGPRVVKTITRRWLFAVYKVAYDFSKTRAPMTGTIFNTINTLIFEEKPLDLKKRIIFNRMKSKKQEDPVRAILFKLIETLQENRSYSSEVKMTMVCDAAAEASDVLLRGLLEKIGADARMGICFLW